MVLVEAMACGTPVLAINRGAVCEIVRDGVTGFVRNTTAELAAVIGRIDEIDRAACRRHVAEHFSSAALVRSFAKLFVPTPDVAGADASRADGLQRPHSRDPAAAGSA